MTEPDGRANQEHGCCLAMEWRVVGGADPLGIATTFNLDWLGHQ